MPETPVKMEQAPAMGLDGYSANDPAVLVSIIPEPSLGVLGAAGLAGLGLRRARFA